MSKHKHRNRERYQGNGAYSRYNNSINNNPFGINPQQLLNMLGNNFNMNNLSSMLSSMNKEGFDFNNNPFDESKVQQENNKQQETNVGENNSFNDIKVNESDDTIEFILSLKAIVDPKRISFLDKIIDLYKEGKI
ncbi:hypothetical protein KQI77_04845 [Clostridium sp. MSJ-8]|uniref:hypothetical protein n=1 Tax=Clostridium sp. MSJ-8 TaxID=2841510 RepID=UPI001C0E9F4D|nr:hypothetical protein [Clostridium sp. MSJ-8]MBU5487490.1 hypothetical protein [Clostridium sp. MSJ-8]